MKKYILPGLMRDIKRRPDPESNKKHKNHSAQQYYQQDQRTNGLHVNGNRSSRHQRKSTNKSTRRQPTRHQVLRLLGGDWLAANRLLGGEMTVNHVNKDRAKKPRMTPKTNLTGVTINQWLI